MYFLPNLFIHFGKYMYIAKTYVISIYHPNWECTFFIPAVPTVASVRAKQNPYTLSGWRTHKAPRVICANRIAIVGRGDVSRNTSRRCICACRCLLAACMCVHVCGLVPVRVHSSRRTLLLMPSRACVCGCVCIALLFRWRTANLWPTAH